MKFKDKNGNVFEDITKAWESFCGTVQAEACYKCCLTASKTGKNLACDDFVREYPTEAARLMGYEVVEDDFGDINKIEEANMEKVNDAAGGREAALGHKQKPLDQWTLGELKEYCVSGVGKNDCLKGTCPFKKICDCIESHNEEFGYVPGDWDLTAPPRFTEEEVADARALIRLLPNAWETLLRNSDDKLWLKNEDEGYLFIVPERFPSILPGQSVKLSEIVGGAL